ncbi:MAG: YdeI/OmpD-associated family protein [Crocinitomicaceae bacterium]|jgi:uncharacterized protein YdeI (YjbR/CyaY-like superfamily)
MNQKVNLFLLDGCGRCKLYQTPLCKVHKWPEELNTLRGLILEFGLEEEIKWGFPCYTLNGKNILMLAPFKDNCAISFFKGALLKENPILEKSGENSNTFRLIRFQGMEKINQEKETIQQIIQEAIEIEKSGKKLPKTDYATIELPVELENAFEVDHIFKAAFKSLTPGRQRGYILHFSQPKQAQTRMNRIEKCKPAIFNGKGLNE